MTKRNIKKCGKGKERKRDYTVIKLLSKLNAANLFGNKTTQPTDKVDLDDKQAAINNRMNISSFLV